MEQVLDSKDLERVRGITTKPAPAACTAALVDGNQDQPNLVGM